MCADASRLEPIPCALYDAGINFLSGGQSEERASANLNAMNHLDTQKQCALSPSLRLISQESDEWKIGVGNEPLQCCLQ